jgi:hypothetical protein
MPEAPSAAPAAIKRISGAKQRAIACLWQLDAARGRERQAFLYAILDTARDKRIYPTLRRLATTEEIVGLYQGPTAAQLAAVAPYLVCLGGGDRVFDWIWDVGWGENWGVFLWSLVAVDTLRSHFRRLTMVQGPHGTRMLFRFYDPRVLREFLPMCDAAQLREMFGPVAAYMVEAPHGDAIITFRNRDRLTASSTELIPSET